MTWEERMRPIRNVLSRVRIKLRQAFGLEITTLLGIGYILGQQKY